MHPSQSKEESGHPGHSSGEWVGGAIAGALVPLAVLEVPVINTVVAGLLVAIIFVALPMLVLRWLFGWSLGFLAALADLFCRRDRD